MNKEIKFLMDKLIEKHGGSFKKINQRTFWEAPTGDHYHVTTVFLRRMAVKPPTKEANAIDSIQEVPVNGGTKSIQPERGSQEVKEIPAKIEEERTSSEAPKKEKKDRKKKPITQVENETKQGEEEMTTPVDNSPIEPIFIEDDMEQL